MEGVEEKEEEKEKEEVASLLVWKAIGMRRLRRCKKKEDKIKDQRCDEMGIIIREE